VGRENPETRRASDIRVIITAYWTKKFSDDHPYIWRYTARRALVIFDHPYNADLVRVA
jgi:hypothetical protein